MKTLETLLESRKRRIREKEEDYKKRKRHPEFDRERYDPEYQHQMLLELKEPEIEVVKDEDGKIVYRKTYFPSDQSDIDEFEDREYQYKA